MGWQQLLSDGLVGEVDGAVLDVVRVPHNVGEELAKDGNGLSLHLRGVGEEELHRRGVDGRRCQFLPLRKVKVRSK